MSLLKSAGNIYFVYQFLTKLTTPFEKTKAFELGIIDKNGKVLKKRSQLKSAEEKEAYTMTDTLIFNLKKQHSCSCLYRKNICQHYQVI